MKKIFALFTALILLLCTAGCNGNTSYSDNGKINVVCTVFPQYDFVRNIAGDTVNLKMLLPPGGEAHSYEPTPKDMSAVADADILISVGGESEEWVRHISKSVKTENMTVLNMIDCVKAVKEETVEGMYTENNAHNHSNEENPKKENTEYDEHVWTSLDNAVILVNKICDTLCSSDQKNSELYKENADKYTKKLKKLNDEMKSAVAASKRKTLIFGDRFPFRYLTDSLGLKYYAAFPGCSSYTEPDSSTIAFLSDKVKQENIPVVFCVDYGNALIAKAIKAETGAKVLRLYSCHSISKQQFENGESYISLMTKNAEAIKEALN